MDHRPRWLGLLALALAAACGEERPADPPVDDTIDEGRHAGSHGGSHGHGHSAGQAEIVDPPPARVHSLRGQVTIAGAETRAGAAVEVAQPIVVPVDGQLTLQLRDGGRVEIAGDSQLRLLPESAAPIALVRGSLYAVQPPMGNAPRAPLRVVTPSATVEIGTAGEIYLAFFENGASWVAVLGGQAAISNGEADNRRQLRTLDLVARQAVAIPGRIAEPTEGPSRLSAAREAGALLAQAEPVAEPDVERLRRELSNEADRLDQALRWLETETRRGRELTNDHRTAVREGNAEESRRLQRQLVTHSQELYRLRRLATARWERVCAQNLRVIALGGSRPEDPVEQRRDRVVGLLGQ